jgi:hypothetical protein
MRVDSNDSKSILKIGTVVLNLTVTVAKEHCVNHAGYSLKQRGLLASCRACLLLSSLLVLVDATLKQRSLLATS